MERRSLTSCIYKARGRLQGKGTRKLAVIHTGVVVAAALLITGLQFVIAEGIGKTGGLSGLGTRSILQTLQTVLQWANQILMPFWGLGFLYAALLWARGQQARKEDLLMGFRRIGPYLGLMLAKGLIAFFVLILTMNISSVLYMLLPASNGVTQMAEAMGNDMAALEQMMETLTWEQVRGLFQAAVPMLVIWGVLSAVLLIPLMYRLRMAEFVILAQPGVRGVGALLLSAALLRKRCWQLFRLDLKLWWYYGLKVLCLGLCYIDLVLTVLGVPAPFGENSALIAYLLYLAAHFAVEVSFRPQVAATYACAYETLVQEAPVPRQEKPKPQNLPWDEV